jgi:hypothetical protein
MFFKEESNKIEQLAAKIHIRKFFYADIIKRKEEATATIVENMTSHDLHTFIINMSGNVGIGTTVTTALNIVKN